MSARQARKRRSVPNTLTPCSHLIRKRGVFDFRRVMSRAPRRAVAISLGTRRYGLAAWLAERLAARSNDALRSASGAMSDQPRPDIAAIIREHLRELLEADLEVIGCVLADALQALAERDPRPVAWAVRQLMAEHGLPEDARNQPPTSCVLNLPQQPV
jgi:hypothetical protein